MWEVCVEWKLDFYVGRWMPFFAVALSWGLKIWKMSKKKGDGWPARSYLSPDLTCHAQGLPSYNGIWWSIKRLKSAGGEVRQAARTYSEGRNSLWEEAGGHPNEWITWLSSGCPGPYPASILSVRLDFSVFLASSACWPSCTYSKMRSRDEGRDWKTGETGLWRDWA